MKKAEMQILAQQLVESGKILMLASYMEEGSEPRKAAEQVANDSINFVLTQLELFCEDADFRKEMKKHVTEI